MKKESLLAATRLANCTGVLADLDGCLWSDGALLPGALELARRFPGRLAVVSNNSTHTPAQLASQLRALGLDLPEAHVCLAGALAVELAARRWPGARVLVLGTRALTDLAAAAGLMPDHHSPEVILLARDLDLTFDRLQAAVRAAARGAPAVAANPDLTHPGRNGAVNVETGALISALRAAVPDMEVTVVGKPAPALFAAALQSLGIEARQAVMIGDNPATDIAGAAAAGIAGVLVGGHPDATAGSLQHLLGRAAPGDLQSAVA
jgi:HAD superfamily hydrolase (TIGR01450 family)